MKLDDVKKFIQLAKKEGVAELKYETKEAKISVNFNQSQSLPVQAMAAPTQSVERGNVNQVQGQSSDEGLHIINSPFVGTYYSASAPGKPAFVKVGDKISKGQTLCILEAMKIMNEIESDSAGEIVEVCADNENLVEYGQPLFKIRV